MLGDFNSFFEGVECFCPLQRKQSRDSRNFSRATHGAYGSRRGGNKAKKYIATPTAKQDLLLPLKVLYGFRGELMQK